MAPRRRPVTKVVVRPGFLFEPHKPQTLMPRTRSGQKAAPEFRPMEPGALSDQEPFTAWPRRGMGQNRVFVENKLYPPRGAIERQRQPP